MSSEGSLVKRYIRGLGLGMLLQLAIGPVCLLVFSTAGTEGFGPACALVLAVGLVDGLYIGLAVAGVGRLLERRTARRLFRVSGGLVLLLFGADLLLSLWGISLLPTLSLGSAAAGPFVRGLLLTLSNPLTIAFWGGVFTARLSEESFTGGELAAFSLGAVSATFLFLTAVAALGTVLRRFLPQAVITGLNGAVGLLIVWFGLRLLWQARRPEDG